MVRCILPRDNTTSSYLVPMTYGHVLGVGGTQSGTMRTMTSSTIYLQQRRSHDCMREMQQPDAPEAQWRGGGRAGAESAGCVLGLQAVDRGSVGGPGLRGLGALRGGSSRARAAAVPGALSGGVCGEGTGGGVPGE